MQFSKRAGPENWGGIQLLQTTLLIACQDNKVDKNRANLFKKTRGLTKKQTRDRIPELTAVGSFFMRNFKLFLLLIAFCLLSTPSFSFAQNIITTGDSTSQTVVENVINTVKVTCCSPTPQQPSPSPKPSNEPTPTGTPGNSPTPTDKPSDGGNGGNDNKGIGGSSTSGETAAAETGPIQAVLGLSTTSSGSFSLLQWIQLFGAFGLTFYGSKFFKKNS